MSRKVKVTVVYTSGAVVHFRCREITVRKVGGELRGVDWTDAKPKPMLLGVDHIAAIYSEGGT